MNVTLEYGKLHKKVAKYAKITSQGHVSESLCREDVLESGGIAPCILNLGTIWK
jgi:hypothetical protein